MPEKLRIVTPGSGKQGAAKKARVHPPTVHKTPRVVSAPTEDSPSPPRPFDTEGVEVRCHSAALPWLSALPVGRILYNSPLIVLQLTSNSPLIHLIVLC